MRIQFRKTLNTGTFHAVFISAKFLEGCLNHFCLNMFFLLFFFLVSVVLRESGKIRELCEVELWH